MNRHFIEVDIQMENKHTFNIPGFREMQIKTTKQYPYTPIRKAKIIPSDNTRWWECGGNGSVWYCWKECKMVPPLWKWVWQFLKKLNTYHMTQQLHPGHWSQRSANLCPPRNLYVVLKGSFTGDSSKLEATKMSYGRWMSKQTEGILIMEYHSAIKRNK